MAKKQYYTNFNEMIIGIQQDCANAFDDVCEVLCQELDDMIIAYTYGKAEGDYYDRTFEMENGGIVHYKKIGVNNAEFYFDDEPITTIDNPHHNILQEGGTMEDLVDYATFGRVEDMRDYIVKRFPQLYRQAMKGKLQPAMSTFTTD